jgi:hypothetical protein
MSENPSLGVQSNNASLSDCRCERGWVTRGLVARLSSVTWRPVRTASETKDNSVLSRKGGLWGSDQTWKVGIYNRPRQPLVVA